MILAFDSSTSHASVALVAKGDVVRELNVETPRGRGGALYSALEEILVGMDGLERIVVGIGPGSYNGIRSALGVGWGIAAARGIPLVGVSSLLGLGLESYVAIGDARRGQYYWAVVEQSAFVEEPVLLEGVEFAEYLSRHPELPRYAATELKTVPDAKQRTPSAALLAKVGADCAPSEGIPEPLYLKPAYVNLPGA
jgi:tRNA threonylcarbamoyladenosine biosynthesis protein TsaB